MCWTSSELAGDLGEQQKGLISVPVGAEGLGRALEC